jgi:bacterial/archaeal transporter family-2 protein
MDKQILLASGSAFLGGIAVSVQAATLAVLGRSVGSLRAGLLTYTAGGLLALVLLLGLYGGSLVPAHTGQPSHWHRGISAGALGIVILATITYSTGRIAVTAGLAIMLVGQMLAAVLLDVLGVGGSTVPVDLRRVAGIGLLAAGAFLVLPR